MTAELLVLVPTRGRPDNARRLVDAFADTRTAATELCFLIDNDDPTADAYAANPGRYRIEFAGPWQPMVPKLNAAARDALGDGWSAFAFMGDDHVPRTRGWDSLFLDQLGQLGTGIVYGNDRLQGSKLCTSWAMTADLVDDFAGMCPAPVDHMFCDNAVLTVGSEAECIRFLGDVVIEHMHPLAGKAEWDASYHAVNSGEQFERDHERFRSWLIESAGDLIARIRERRSGVKDPLTLNGTDGRKG